MAHFSQKFMAKNNISNISDDHHIALALKNSHRTK